MKKGNYKTEKARKQDVNRNRGRGIHHSGQRSGAAIDRGNIEHTASFGATMMAVVASLFGRQGKR